MLVADKLGIFMTVRSSTFGQNADFIVNSSITGDDMGQVLKNLMRSFMSEIHRVGIPNLDMLESYVKSNQPSIYRALTNNYNLLQAEVKPSTQKPDQKPANSDANQPDQKTEQKEPTSVNPNRSTSPEVIPDFSVRDSSHTGKGRRLGPMHPMPLPEAKAQAPEVPKVEIKLPRREQVFAKDPEGKPVDAWKIIDGVADDLRKIAVGKAYLEDPDLRKIEDRILRNLLKPQGGGMKLLGPAGSGKSFLLERLAIRFATGDVPVDLRDYHVLQTSAVQLEAGTNYVGTIESTVNAMIETSKSHKILWIVDEAHALRSSGTHSKKSTNILQSFLPGMATGYLKFLFASTPDNWSEAYESDPAFDRRLDRVDLPEANHEQLIQRLRNWMKNYNLPEISEKALERIIFYSGEFAIEGSQLSKSTALLSEIASIKVMNSDRSEISVEEVKAAVKELYNVDPAELETERKIERYRKLQANFENLVGQEEAKEAILRNTRQVFAGVIDRNKPRQRVLLAGLKGQGKTEMVKLFAEAMGLPTDNRLVMSEFSTPYDTNKMKERIAQLVHRNPFTVLFFDEIEKAHPDVQKALLGILDSGMMTYTHKDSSPLKIMLKNTSIFMATNAGSDFIMQNARTATKVQLGFINSDSSSKASRDVPQNQFRQALVADGLNEYLLDRMNVVTAFKILTKGEFKKVLEVHFRKGIREIERNSQTNVEIRNLGELVQSLGDKLYFPGISNREVERIVNDELRQRVADVVFESGSQKVQLDWKAGSLQPALRCDGIFIK